MSLTFFQRFCDSARYKLLSRKENNPVTDVCGTAGKKHSFAPLEIPGNC